MRLQGVYPRMYGETFGGVVFAALDAGLSPHVRGNPGAAPRSGVALGSIPACTGKPHRRRRGPIRSRVYPRMYGETGDRAALRGADPGLSPHVRGNRRWGRCQPPAPGSIPACTGKPTMRVRIFTWFWVYPRMYGETLQTCTESNRVCGLSPHVRGNRVRVSSGANDTGSIPACTGKPSERAGGAVSTQVYPRMYGETRGRYHAHKSVHGLSPHVRGNQLKRTVRPGSRRSIPACTGKPGEGVPVLLAPQVYPRMYGETVSCRDKLNHDNGLSPHVRGNLQHAVAVHADRGSIPACTGKPGWNCRRGCCRRVYPRMYGETMFPVPSAPADAGLSPHVRGNHALRIGAAQSLGSIPACTGKPRQSSSGWRACWVYPRMYGETFKTAKELEEEGGLSPHVRGNLCENLDEQVL